MEIGIVCARSAFLYGNTQCSSVTDEVLSGWPVRIHRKCGGLLEIVTHYGYGGWVNGSAIRRVLPEEYGFWGFWGSGNVVPRTSFFQCRECLEPAILCKGITDILSGPKVQAHILSTLFMGSTVLAVGEPQDGWQKVKAAGEICGFVPSCSLLRYSHMEKIHISKETDGFVPSCSLMRYSHTEKIHISKETDGFIPSCSLMRGGKDVIPQKELGEITPETERLLRSSILRYAESYLGTQYRWGGKSHAGIDCSGLAFMAYYMCGILIYRDAAIADGYPVHEIPSSQMKPADLLYFPGHVALYLGDGKFIHATGNLKTFGCTINSLNAGDPDYRGDLAESLIAVGSIFP